MAERMRRSSTPINPSAKPTRVGSLVFASKVRLLRLQRTLENLRSGPKRYVPAPLVHVASSKTHRSKLWTSDNPQEQGLQMGKIHNLRVAARSLHGIKIPAGEILSFWEQVGRPVRSRGFVAGRELREGCIIATPGGGLCQLSNALYQLALDAGLEICERHPHTQVVPGSATEIGRDATVAWNHIDLRFRAGCEMRFEVVLTRDELLVTLQLAEVPTSTPTRGTVPLRMVQTPGSCETCGENDCHRHQEPAAQKARQGLRRSGFLLDAATPEFVQHLGSQAEVGDQVLVPLRGERFSLDRYDWKIGEGWDVETATWPAFRRSRNARKSVPPPVARANQLRDTAAVAERLGKRLAFDAMDVKVDLALLAELSDSGVLAGRDVEVWLTRFPLNILQGTLDRAALRYPEAPLLTDFRADADLVEREWRAILEAGRVATPHPFLASHFETLGLAVTRLEWLLPSVPQAEVRDDGYAFFPGPTAAREGAIAVREACRELGIKVSVGGRNLGESDFWAGVETLPAQEYPMERASVVMCPAVTKSRPSAALRARALGKPVIATPESGVPGAVEVAFGDHQQTSLALAGLMSKAP